MLPEWFAQLGLMRWPLAICSILTLMVALERLYFFINVSINRQEVIRKLRTHLTEHRNLQKQHRDEVVSILVQDIHRACNSGIRLLRMIGTISPILGLLGTILGIIKAFRVIAAQTGPVSPAMIADGLWEAMLTTAAGLMIALPALLLSYLFHYLAERHINPICMDLNRLSMSFELGNEEKETMPTNVKRLSA